MNAPQEYFISWLIVYLRNMDVEERQELIFVDLDYKLDNAIRENKMILILWIGLIWNMSELKINPIKSFKIIFTGSKR